MNRYHTSCTMLVICGLVGILSMGGSYGQPPADSRPPHDVPSLEPEPVPRRAEPQAAEKIRDVLQGDSTQTAPGVLGDVLEVIRSRGSVLDGSVLDQPDDLSDATPTTPAPAHRVSATQNRDQSVQTAEALLRTARMLESMTKAKSQLAGVPADAEADSEMALVNQMRIRATRLLLAAYPEATSGR